LNLFDYFCRKDDNDAPKWELKKTIGFNKIYSCVINGKVVLRSQRMNKQQREQVIQRQNFVKLRHDAKFLPSSYCCQVCSSICTTPIRFRECLHFWDKVCYLAKQGEIVCKDPRCSVPAPSTFKNPISELQLQTRALKRIPMIVSFSKRIEKDWVDRSVLNMHILSKLMLELSPFTPPK
jgi:hypothetical protein